MDCTVGKEAGRACPVGKEAGQACPVGKGAGQACQVRGEVLGTRGTWSRHSDPGRTEINEHEFS